MLLSNSVLRRYTPPTCTLEIVAKSSPLSRWVGQAVLKDLRFELRFDDPRKADDNRVTIRGDRADLEMLYDVVSSYVQDFLDPSSAQLPVLLHAGSANSMLDDDSSGESPALPGSGSDRSHLLAAHSPREEPDNLPSVRSLGSEPKLRLLKPRTVSTEIYLKPKSLLSHNLFLGQLANEESGPVIDLSVLQLFDLATALDEYAAEVVALPNLNRSTGKQVVPAWSWAAVALVAVGVTAAGIKLLNKPEAAQVATNAEEQESSRTAETPAALQVPPLLPSPLPTSPLPTPVVPPTLSSSPVLPPPAPVTPPPPPTQPQTVSPPPAGSRQTITISPPAGRTAISAKPIAPDLGRIASAPSPSASRTGNSPSPSGNPLVQNSRPKPSTTPFELPSLPPLASSIEGGASRSASQPAAESDPVSGAVNQAEPAPTETAANGKLFDTIPQVAEIRSYLKERWQPPSGLTQTLEYTLLLNADGSIQRIIPLGKAAGDYIDRTAIPRPGQPFVSAVDEQRNPTIRVVLTPDGGVETFLESMN